MRTLESRFRLRKAVATAMRIAIAAPTTVQAVASMSGTCHYFAGT